MNAQVFRGRTVVEAKRAAFEALGPDAIVVSTRQVSRPGVSGLFGGADFEVAAAPPVGLGEPLPSRRSATVPFASGVYGAESAPRAPAALPDLGALRAELKGDIRALKSMLTKTSDSSHLASEIGELRDLIEGLAEPKARAGKAANLLKALGIEGPAATAIARELPGKAPTQAQMRDLLRKTVATTAWPLSGERTLIGLVGSSGVGKTTTAAKLGAHARADGRTVTFVACDAYRVGAIEQLTGYARLMGAELEVAETSDALRAIIDGARTDVVIVDTSGRPPMADGAELALAPHAGGHSGRSRHVLLCATASLRANDAGRLARRFAILGPTGMVITKIDETGEPAGLVHGPWATKLPLSVLCFGQRVPEDISAATPEAVLGHLMPAREKAAAA